MIGTYINIYKDGKVNGLQISTITNQVAMKTVAEYALLIYEMDQDASILVFIVAPLVLRINIDIVMFDNNSLPPGCVRNLFCDLILGR